MTSPVILMLAPLLGVAFGYEPSTDAEEGYDYTVQVEQLLLEQMQNGNASDIEVNIPPEVTPIRRIRIVVGDGPLTKTLRPGATARTTFRQDLDSAATPSIDLLAQTGPAGGFGRNATGFNGAATRPATPPAITSTPNPTNTATVPAPDTNFGAPTTASAYDLRGQLDAGFQAAESGLTGTRDAIRGSLNSVGSTGQEVLDNTRRTLSDVVGPPDNRSFNAQNTPLENLAGSVQDNFNNTTNAMRDSIDRATGSDRYASRTQDNAPAGTTAGTTPPRWDGAQPSGAALPSERSVLTNTGSTAAAANSTSSETEQQYWDRLRREQQLREQQLREQQALEQQRRQQQAALAANNGGAAASQFPEQPLQSLPARQQPGVVQPMVDRSLLNTVGNPAPTQVGGPALAAPMNSRQPFSDPYNQALEPTAARDNLLTNDSLPGIGTAAPAITTAAATTQSTSRPNVDAWTTEAESKESETTETPSNSTGLPGAVWAWAIAVGLAVGNMFQWLNIVDMRNKYRVALRRNSPNFARSMAA